MCINCEVEIIREMAVVVEPCHSHELLYRLVNCGEEVKGCTHVISKLKIKLY